MVTVRAKKIPDQKNLFLFVFSGSDSFPQQSLHRVPIAAVIDDDLAAFGWNGADVFDDQRFVGLPADVPDGVLTCESMVHIDRASHLDDILVTPSGNKFLMRLTDMG